MEEKGSQIGPPRKALIPESRGHETDPAPAKGRGSWMPLEVLRMFPKEEAAAPHAGLRAVPVPHAGVEAIDEPDSRDGPHRVVFYEPEDPIDIAYCRELLVEFGSDRSLESHLAQLRREAIEDRPVNWPVQMSVPPCAPVRSAAPADRDRGGSQTFEGDLEPVGREFVVIIEEHDVPTSCFLKPGVASPGLTDIRGKPHHTDARIRERRSRRRTGIVNDNAFEVIDSLTKHRIDRRTEEFGSVIGRNHHGEEWIAHDTGSPDGFRSGSRDARIRPIRL